VSVTITCPSCGLQYPVDAGLIEGDGKRLAAVVAEMEPQLARTALAYLRLFKPPKSALRTARAVKILQELLELVKQETVCKDERGGIRRPAPPAAWCAGIEQMLQQPGRLSLPLSNHNYLRQIVFGLADAADANAERQRDQQIRSAPRGGSTDSLEPMNNHLRWLGEQLKRGLIDQAGHDAQVATTRVRHAVCLDCGLTAAQCKCLDTQAAATGAKYKGK